MCSDRVEVVNRDVAVGALDVENAGLAVLAGLLVGAGGAVVVEERVQTGAVDEDGGAVLDSHTPGVEVGDVGAVGVDGSWAGEGGVGVGGVRGEGSGGIGAGLVAVKERGISMRMAGDG